MHTKDVACLWLTVIRLTSHEASAVVDKVGVDLEPAVSSLGRVTIVTGCKRTASVRGSTIGHASRPYCTQHGEQKDKNPCSLH